MIATCTGVSDIEEGVVLVRGVWEAHALQGLLAVIVVRATGNDRYVYGCG